MMPADVCHLLKERAMNRSEAYRAKDCSTDDAACVLPGFFFDRRLREI